MSYGVDDSEQKDWARNTLQGLFFGNTTPFTESLDLNEDALRTNLRHCIQLQARGLGAGGPLGEPFVLTLDERKTIHRILAEEAQAAAAVSYAYPVMDSLPATIDLASHAVAVGCDLLMINPPFEWIKTDSQIVGYFAAVAEACPTSRIMLYDTPHSGYQLPIELYEHIAALPQVCCVKRGFERDSDGSTQELLERFGDRLVLGGSWRNLVMNASLGVSWVTPTSAGYLLQREGFEPLQLALDSALHGDLARASNIYEVLQPLTRVWKGIYQSYFNRTTGREVHPVAGVKAWQDFLNMNGGLVRPPNENLSDAYRAQVEHELSQAFESSEKMLTLRLFESV